MSTTTAMPRRRTILTAAAWTAPVISIGVAAPAVSASAIQTPDLTVKVTGSSTTLARNSVNQIFYAITNVGTAATNGSPIVVNIFKTVPASGVTLSEVSVPSGWTLTNTTSTYWSYTYNGVMMVGASFNLIFNATTAGNATVPGSVLFRGTLVNGSGGDTNNTNNVGNMTLQVTP